MVSLETTVAGVKLTSCVYNASGPRTGSAAALGKITASKAGAVLAKSATVEKQMGNPQPRTWHDAATDGASLNSEGLPNSGIAYYLSKETIDESMGAPATKPYMVSISGKTLADNLEMLKKIVAAKDLVDAIELNLACPNVIGKPIIGYDFDQMKSVLKAVSKVKGIKDIPLGIKMPPYFDGPHFEQAATIVNSHKAVVRYVASINTIGNALAIDPVSEAPVIASKGGFAGLSGRAVKYTALANVQKMRALLDPSIDVVGVGGIETGTDAFEMILAGAKAVQVGTCHWKEGPKCFDRICDELEELMTEKGYASVDDFYNKLKPWSKDGAALSRAAKKKKEETEKVATIAAAEEAAAEAAAAAAIQAKSAPIETPLIVCAVLIVLVAILLADKYGVVNI